MKLGRFILFVLLSAFSTLSVAQGGYTTPSFNVDLSVGRDRTLDVTEVITVDFFERRRGLIRWIPTRYRAGEGPGRVVRVELVGVRQLRAPTGEWRSGEGERAQTQATATSDRWQVRIGNPSVYLRGPVRYTIQYRVRGALTDFEEAEPAKSRTELYWNTLPLEWPTPIESSEISVAFPNSPGGTPPMLRAFWGPAGSKNAVLIRKPGAQPEGPPILSATLALDANGTVGKARVKSRAPCPPGWGITVAVAMRKGSVDWVGREASMEREPSRVPPSGSPDTSGLSSDQVPVLPNTVGGQPFESFVRPPGNPFLGWLPLGVALGAIALFRWFLRTPNVGPIVTRFDPPPGIGAAECGVLLDQRFDTRDFMAGIVSLAQKGEVKLRGEGAFDARHLSIEIGSWNDVSAVSPIEQKIGSALKGFGPVVRPSELAGSFGHAFASVRNYAFGWLEGAGYYRTVGCGARLLLFMLAVGLMIPATIFAFSQAPAFALLSLILGLAFLVPGFSTGPRLTEQGARAKNEVLGLREFVRRAHGQELEHALRTVPAQALFERLLPYAMAFGLVEEWTRQFDGIALAVPDWYEPGAASDGVAWTQLIASDWAIANQDWDAATTIPAAASYDSDSSSSSSGWDFGSGSSSFSDFGSSGGGSDSSGGGDSGGGGGGGGGDSW